MESALAALWPFTHELFESDAVTPRGRRRGRRCRPGGAPRPRGTRTSAASSATPRWSSRNDLADRPGPARAAHRAVWVHARRDAASPSLVSGRDVVSRVDEIRRLAGAIPDPEMPALTLADLGILRDVRIDRSGHVDRRHHADLLGVPGARHHPRGCRAVRSRPGLRRRDGAHRALAGMDDGVDVRGRPVSSSASTASRRPASTTSTSHPDGSGRVPAVQLIAHARARALRVDAMPGGAPVRRTAARHSRTSRSTEGLTATPVAEASAGHRRATIHPLRVKASSP